MSGNTDGSINPFQTVLCRCVICEQDARFSRLKSTLYTETKRDIDLRPITVLWSKKVSPRVDPKLFYFWQCPHCSFTADHQFFTAPFKDGSMSVGRFRRLFHKAKEATPSYLEVVHGLRIDPSKEKSVFISGLKLNLLAIFSLEMIEEISKGDSLMLASYYLRLAWMMRDLRHLRDKNPQVYESAKTLISQLQKSWPKLSLIESDNLQVALRYYQQALLKSHSINTMLSEIQVRLVIARIFLKTGKLPEAKRCLIESKSKVNSYDMIFKKKTKEKGSFSEQEIQDMETALGKAQTLLATVEQIYERIESMMIEKQVQEAQLLLRGLRDKTYEEKLALLQSKGVAQPIIEKALPSPKKKGLIDLLKSS
ncbi:MAG: DUF2225 domain-containing protein [Oligoflexus sp.]|jgi:hypothetical protein